MTLAGAKSSKKKTKNLPPSIVYGFLNALTACAEIIFSHLHVTVSPKEIIGQNLSFWFNTS